MTEKRLYRTWRTGTVTFTIIEAYPYHKAIDMVDHKGAGAYEMAYAPAPLWRKEHADDQGCTPRTTRQRGRFPWHA